MVYRAANLFQISIWYCFLTSSSFSFLRLNPSTSNYYASCLHTANLPLAFATTREWSESQSAPLTSNIGYTRTPSSIYQYVINLVVSLPIRRGPGVLMNVWVLEHFELKNLIFWCDKVYHSNTINITILMYTFIPNCQFENILSPHFC
jgi:hypothetical protein